MVRKNWCSTPVFVMLICMSVALVGPVGVFASDGEAAQTLRWDSSEETIVSETKVAALASAAPEEHEQAGGSGGEPPEGAGKPEGGGKPNTGNDPRDFSSKFMPYYRGQRLKNEMETRDFTMFGMWAMSSKFAMTYEIPMSRYYDITKTDVCAGLPDRPCFGDVPFEGNPTTGSPLLVGAGEGDGEEVGLGDSIIRIFAGTNVKLWGGAFIPGLDITVPTATKDILGGQQFVIGPIFTFVWDNKFWPAPGSFWAMMNIFQFDVWKDPSRDDVGRFFGRWFLQLPLQKEHKLYMMVEFQPLYDWEAEHFSFWVGPEFGKAFAPGGGLWRNGGAIYFKPGWGVGADNLTGDRAWSIEVGFRYFFPAPRETYKMMQQQKGGG